MTLQDYADKVLTPSLVARIRSGSLDFTFTDPVCLLMMIKDEKLRNALIKQLEVMVMEND